ncbi:hypothetical protein K432DRAFT_410570 [Lepidopterella palustris CBS 459.81]|uniref:Uncharacterized protein n=1 Tax=Lepidopterella palustris CBS 459.81 TaxID=1314670 RepID=A0A8E2DXY5_9PEZI|nr:hypothetical protein K432DRAFT_410570 [Lepidopterella palustris CBS 459.81]
MGIRIVAIRRSLQARGATIATLLMRDFGGCHGSGGLAKQQFNIENKNRYSNVGLDEVEFLLRTVALLYISIVQLYLTPSCDTPATIRLKCAVIMQPSSYRRVELGKVDSICPTTIVLEKSTPRSARKNPNRVTPPPHDPGLSSPGYEIRLDTSG